MENSQDNPDIDSVVSGVLVARLFKYLGISCRFVIRDNIVEDKIAYILLRYGINIYYYKAVVEEKYLSRNLKATA